MINIIKLEKELKEAGVNTVGVSNAIVHQNEQNNYIYSYCTYSCRIDFDHIPTSEECLKCDDVIKVHNPNPTYVELRQKEYTKKFDGVNNEYGQQLDPLFKWYESVKNVYPQLQHIEMDMIKAKRDEVKNEIPKPE